MKLDNIKSETISDSTENITKFNPDKMWDSRSTENSLMDESKIKISEETKYDPDKLICKECAIENKENGDRRQEEVYNELVKQYPETKGYKILSECTLRDRNGDTVKDENGSKRRVDFAVVKDGKVVDMVEVTSKNATKTDQMKKEYDIRAKGGNYIKNPETGDLYRIPDNVNTRIERRD